MAAATKLGLRAIVAALGKAIFPAKCHLCGAFCHPSDRDRRRHDTAFQHALRRWLCDDCARDYAAITSPLCPRCGRPFVAREGDDHLCGDCRRHPAVFDRARAAGVYDGALRALILRFKFQGQVGLAVPLGGLLLETFLNHWQADDIDLILPVPLHSRRMRRRGFNQAYLLLRRWSVWYEAQHQAPLPCRIERDLLRRIRPTAPQTGLKRAAREDNLKKAFKLRTPQACAGKRILLVDDILTTGATVNACARVLRQAQARRVDVLTLARAV
ncbi:MAG: ComF family protein [Desulfosarcinaceae bacterium]|nr:ComF family protein [Desulfosarcinaceae bacterium]